MEAVQVDLDGPFVDAFVYRTQLYAATYSGELRVFSVPAIEEALTSRYGNAGAHASYWMFHAAGRGSTPRQQQAKRGSTAARMSITMSNLEFKSYDLSLEGTSVLDLNVYNDTLFIASDSGLWSSPVGRDRPLDIARPLRTACYSVVGRWGAMAASRGPKGLALMFDYFNSWSTRNGLDLRQDISGSSVRASYAGQSLVNYKSRRSFAVLEGELHDADTSKGQMRMLTRVRQSEPTETIAHDRLARVDLDLEPEEIFNFGSRFVVLAAGGAYIVRTQLRKDGRRTFGPARWAGSYTGRVQSAAVLDEWPIVETDSGVICLADDAPGIALFEGPAIAVRTFPSSFRYNRLVTITGDSGITLSAITG